MPDSTDTKAWLRAVAAHLNLSLSALAQKAGPSPSTLTRYLNDRSGKLTITEATLDAISTYSGIPKHVMPGESLPPGLRESEAVPFAPPGGDPPPEWVRAAVAAAKGNRNGVDAWVMKGWALDLLGIIPGDVLIIDHNKRPKSGQIVCAQITDPVTGQTETVMRRFDPPYLTAHSAKLGYIRPEQIDEERVVVTGVEIGVIRPRH